MGQNKKPKVLRIWMYRNGGCLSDATSCSIVSAVRVFIELRVRKKSHLKMSSAEKHGRINTETAETLSQPLPRPGGSLEETWLPLFQTVETGWNMGPPPPGRCPSASGFCRLPGHLCLLPLVDVTWQAAEPLCLSSTFGHLDVSSRPLILKLVIADFISCPQVTKGRSLWHLGFFIRGYLLSLLSQQFSPTVVHRLPLS